MAKLRKIVVNETQINVSFGKTDKDDYICLTDMAKGSGDVSRAADIIKNWIRNRATIEFLGAWETVYNPNFNVVEFDHFKREAGLPTFTLSVSGWVEKTSAIGIYSRSGRYGGGTYAHKDIAFEFGAAISPMFKLFLIKEYQRLREKESNPLLAQWEMKRLLSKTNYALHTDAIKNVVIPKLDLSKMREAWVYSSEADMLNIVMFGCTAKDWEEANPSLAKKGMNLRDTASINQLVVLSNLEVLNAEMIKQNVPQQTRRQILHRMAKEQQRVLDQNNSEQKFKKLAEKGNLLT